MNVTAPDQQPVTHHPTPRVGFLQVLSNRDFLTLWIAQIISTLGSWITLFALLSFAGFNLKIANRELGGMAAGFLLTQALVLPIAGVLIDRLDVKKTLIANELVRAALVLILIFSSQLVYLYPLVLVLSAGACLFVSGLLTAVPRIVRMQELIIANSLTTQVFQLSAVLAPIIAGAIIARLGSRACFLINSVTFLLSAGCLMFVSIKRTSSNNSHVSSRNISSKSNLRGFAADSLIGLRFVASNKLVAFVVLSAAITILAAGWVHTLGVIYVRDVLTAGPGTLGVLLSTLGAGAVVGLFLVGKLGQNVSRFKMIVAGTVAIAVGITLLTLVSRESEAFVLAFLLGTAAITVLLPSQTLVQEQTPPDLLGRVGGVSWSLILLSQATSVSLAGVAADWIGIRTLYRLASVILMLTALVGVIWIKRGHSSLSRIR
jgi:MFS family permease